MNLAANEIANQRTVAFKNKDRKTVKLPIWRERSVLNRCARALNTVYGLPLPGAQGGRN